MAASNAAVVAAMDSVFASLGITYDGSTDGYVDSLTWDQLQELVRVVKAAGGNIVVTSGIMFIKPAPTDTSAN